MYACAKSVYSFVIAVDFSDVLVYLVVDLSDVVFVETDGREQQSC